MAASQTLFVKPAPGRTVHVPERDYRELRADGETVPRTSYWTRRLADRDVIEAVEETAAEPQATAPAAPAERPRRGRATASTDTTDAASAAASAPATTET